MTSSSTSPSWNDDQVDELLTKFYAQEVPAELRDASRQLDRVENTGLHKPSKRVWQAKWFVTSALALIGLPLIGWVWWSSHDAANEMTDSPAVEASDDEPTRTPSLADDAGRAAPVESPRRIQPARLTDPHMHPDFEMPEWEIQVFPIEEPEPISEDPAPAIAEPATRRHSR